MRRPVEKIVIAAAPLKLAEIYFAMSALPLSLAADKDRYRHILLHE